MVLLRRQTRRVVEVFEIIHGLSSIKFCIFFEYSTSDRTRGHSLKLTKKRARLDMRQHFFSQRVTSGIASTMLHVHCLLIVSKDIKRHFTRMDLLQDYDSLYDPQG